MQKHVMKSLLSEQRAKDAKGQLTEWRGSNESERRVAESLHHDAEEKLLYAEKAHVEELALEAQHASKDTMEYGDSSRLVDMYTNAQQLRIHNLYVSFDITLFSQVYK
mmetsp:Transcript_28090/g.41683  ORF Transcript_28090/g.41683 Transcript_28090/m.41683 type:complete len:108 (-) Transcript_28090:152-475(-)